MLLLWKEDISYWKVGLGYAFIGIGVGFAGTPASHSLTGSVPVQRAGMASGTADLQRDLGGAIMQSIFGALLTAGYARRDRSRDRRLRTSDVTTASQSQLTKSFASAEDVAEQYPQYADQITAAAKTSFLEGDQWAYIGRHRRDPARRGARLLPASRRRTRRRSCSPPTMPPTRRARESTERTPLGAPEPSTAT